MNLGRHKQLINLMEIMEKSLTSLDYCIENGKGKEAQTLLEECQSSAILAGNTIEASEGTETQTVKALENYCEDAYALHEILGDIDAGTNQIKEAKEKLKASIEKAKKLCQEEIKPRRTVVFLPYKASMWDSLESVWRKADADKDTDAYVIPIPYYDKNPNGEFAAFHYEGGEFPKDVPITSYEDFDLEAEHPDEIYIHNPYDSYNYVTSVHPDFYSDKLKNYTELLVYIPYFVLAEVDPNNKAAAEGIYHFAQTKGVINADKVIVQSEDMRQIYIDAMCAFAGEETRPKWEKKIFGTGSPKFDKVLNTSRDDVEIPEDWKPIIYKPDGSRRKVVFYNTSVTALLNAKEDMITKIKDVFDVFRAHKEEVALLWRPHPLMEATISSMEPELWEEYKQIVADYKEEGFGIYDDSADMDRAIALADAYYGDGSSVVQLCQKVGMPIMIQNVNVLNSDDEDEWG